MKLSKSINRFIFLIAFISTSLAFLVSAIFQYINFEKDKKYIYTEFIQFKKNELKKEIEIVFNLIEQRETIIKELAITSKDEVNIQKIRNDNQNEILNWLATYKFGKSSYIFVNNLNAQALIWDNKKLEIPKSYPLKSLYEKQLDAIKNPEGDFIFYKFKKPNTLEEFDKIAFVKKYKDYNWIIGTGAYLDEVENEINRKKELFKKSIVEQLESLILIFIFILIIIYFISKTLSKYVNKNINNLTLSFEKASQENNKIDTKNLTYKEFISLANNLNITLENKNRIEEKLQDYIKIVNEHVIISTIDQHGIIQDVSEAFCKISGYTKEELIGKSYDILRNEETSEEFYQEMCQKLSNEKNWRGEIQNKNKQGETYWVEAIVQAIFEEEKFVGYTTIRTDITNKKIVEYLSITDELTKLYNRRFFNTKFEEEINRAKRENNYFSLLIIDIDYFKEYNDTYGHQEGDSALSNVANVLINHTNRSSDFAFRLGGEEFGIITISEKEKIIEFATHIKNTIEKLKIPHSKSIVSNYLTISIGITSRKGNDISTSAILYKEADDALYIAKNNGRNCIFVQE
jgi:diguanylate cyclase (GGDEF)-like protein/PAS domain S-box-containing protein